MALLYTTFTRLATVVLRPLSAAHAKKRALYGRVFGVSRDLFLRKRLGQALDGYAAVTLGNMRGQARHELVVIEALNVAHALQVNGVKFALRRADAAAMHMYSSSTTAPQPRQRSVSFLSCSSVKVPRRSRKVFFASSGLPSAAFWRGAGRRLFIGTTTLSLSRDRYSFTALPSTRLWPSCTKRWMEMEPPCLPRWRRWRTSVR